MRLGSFLICSMLLGAVIGGICWPYAINTWLGWAGKPQTISWWVGSLLGVVPFVRYWAIPSALVTWIVATFVL